MNNMLQYKDYYGSVEFSAADECFHGRIYGINDTVSFEGESVFELKKAFEEAVDDYLDLCARYGKDAPKVYKGSFNVRVAPEVHQAAAFMAASEKISLNQYVERALQDELKKDGAY